VSEALSSPRNHGLLGFIAALAALGLAASPSEALAAPFTKGPYLQALGMNGVTVKVELEAQAPAKLEVYAAGSERVVATAESPEAWTFHAMRVDILKPGTAYEYRVLSQGVKSELGHFTTAPEGDRPFRFQVYGDSRTDAAAHAAVVRAMRAVPADFLVNTGDMVHSGIEPRDWEELFSIENEMLRERCVFAAVGNHEIYRGDRQGGVAFLRYFATIEQGRDRPHLYGSFRWSNTRFFLLNAMDTWTGEEREWLRAELDLARTEPGLLHRIAVLHHGPFSSGPHGPNKAFVAADIVGLMRDRKVDLVLAGHDHLYERGEGEGLKYLISGGAGAPLYERKSKDPHTQAVESVHHFVEITVEGDSIKTVARRASGGIIEACGFRAGGPWSCDASMAKAAPTTAMDTAPAKSGAPASAVPAGKAACACALVGDPSADGETSGPRAAVLGALFALAFARAARRSARRGERG
jgi:hypothetical protein